MKKIIGLVAAGLMMVGCAKKMVITTEGDHTVQGMVYLSEGAHGEVVDSAEIVGGELKWTPRVKMGNTYRLNVPALRFHEFVLTEPGTLVLHLEDGQITGTPLNDAYNEVNLAFAEEGQNEATLTALLETTLDAHLNDALGSVMLYYLDMFEERALVMAHFDKVGERAQQTFLTQEQMALWRLQASTEAGQPMVDFEVEYAGEVKRLSDFVGQGRKLTVVDFWASWCGPCCREIPGLIALYEKYKDCGVEVVGVATWDKPEDSKAAIQRMGITYPQILNAQAIGSDAYGIQGIPEIMIIDGEGNIWARGLRGEAIEDAVRALLFGEEEE